MTISVYENDLFRQVKKGDDHAFEKLFRFKGSP